MVHGRDAGSDDGSPCILYNRKTGTQLLKLPVNVILMKMSEVFRHGQRNERMNTKNIWLDSL